MLEFSKCKLQPHNCDLNHSYTFANQIQIIRPPGKNYNEEVGLCFHIVFTSLPFSVKHWPCCMQVMQSHAALDH